MCLKLGNKRHCLTLLSILGGLQVLISLPIIALSFVVFFRTTLGTALSPFWCGFVASPGNRNKISSPSWVTYTPRWIHNNLLVTGFIAIFIRPTRFACLIFTHVVLNAFSICACFLAAGITGLYGTAVHIQQFDQFDQFVATNNGTGCIFAVNSPLYTPEFRNAFRPIDGLIDSCENLLDYWEYLISLMSLSFMGLLMSIIAIISNCITPCVEDRYDSWEKTDV